LGRIGTTEIILIVVVILILFGAKRIPQLMRSLGSGVREFKKGAKGDVEDEGGGEDKRPADEGKGAGGEEKDVSGEKPS
jgi:sec-independent protein translocase protein TatA